MHIAREASRHLFTIHSYRHGVVEVRHPLPTTTEGEREANIEQMIQPFIISPNALQNDWQIDETKGIDARAIEPLLALDCEVILLGTGERLCFPSQAVLGPLMGRGIGVEVMDSGAVCRTYNILVNEGRQVVAALLMP